jgi:hypothetical protein
MPRPDQSAKCVEEPKLQPLILIGGQNSVLVTGVFMTKTISRQWKRQKATDGWNCQERSFYRCVARGERCGRAARKRESDPESEGTYTNKMRLFDANVKPWQEHQWCLAQINREFLAREIRSYERKRNRQGTTISWRFTTNQARTTPARHYTDAEQLS